MKITDLLKRMNIEIKKEMPGYSIQRITLSASGVNNKNVTENLSSSDDIKPSSKCYEWDEENQVYVEVPCF